jgi:hypothetical protein
VPGHPLRRIHRSGRTKRYGFRHSHASRILIACSHRKSLLKNCRHAKGELPNSLNPAAFSGSNRLLARQAAEKLKTEGDGGFIPRVSPAKSTPALAAEGRFSSKSLKSPGFSAACRARMSTRGLRLRAGLQTGTRVDRIYDFYLLCERFKSVALS